MKIEPFKLKVSQAQFEPVHKVLAAMGYESYVERPYASILVDKRGAIGGSDDQAWVDSVSFPELTVDELLVHKNEN